MRWIQITGTQGGESDSLLMSGSSMGLSHSQPSQEVGDGTQVALTPILIQKLWSVQAPFVSWLPHFILVEGNYVYS